MASKNRSPSTPKLIVVEDNDYPPESILSSHDVLSTRTPTAASPRQNPVLYPRITVASPPSVTTTNARQSLQAEGPILAEVVETPPVAFQEQEVVIVTQVPGTVQQEQIVPNQRLREKNKTPQQVVMPMSSSFFNISSVQESRVNLVLWVASNPPSPGKFLRWIKELKQRIAEEGKFSIECCKKCEEKRLVDMFIYANKNRGHLIIEFMESAALKEEPDYDDLLSFCAHKDEEGGTATFAHNDDDELDMIPKKHKARVELTVWTTQEEPTDVNLSFSEWLREVKDVVSTEGMYSEECCKNCDDLRVFDLFVLRHRKDKALLWELFSSMTTGKADFIDFVVFCHSMDTSRLSANRRKRSFNNAENNQPGGGLQIFNSPLKREYHQQGFNLRDDVSSIGSPAYGSISTISKTPPSSFHGSSMARSMSNASASGQSISSGYTSLDDSVHTSFNRVPLASTPMSRDRLVSEGQISPSEKDSRFMEYQIRTTNFKGLAVKYPGHEGKAIQWREMDAEYFRELMHRYPKEEFGEKRAEMVYEALGKAIPLPVITSRLLSFDKKEDLALNTALRFADLKLHHETI